MYGDVAQLGERAVRIRKVESSILFVSTIPYHYALRGVFFMEKRYPISSGSTLNQRFLNREASSRMLPFFDVHPLGPCLYFLPSIVYRLFSIFCQRRLFPHSQKGYPVIHFPINKHEKPHFHGEADEILDKAAHKNGRSRLVVIKYQPQSI